MSFTNLFISKILANVGANSKQLPNSKITGFLPIKGNKYTGDLMVVGRAVNGWCDGIYPSDLNDPLKAQRYSDLVESSVTSGDVNVCPMQWVVDSWGNIDGYNTKRSSFWRTIRQVVGELNINDIESNSWASKLVWSNLYKISPTDGGNPSDKLCDISFPGCVELLNMEIEVFKPSKILLLTGANWADGFLSISEPKEKCKFDYVEKHGIRGDIKCVIASHPQGKEESLWVNEVVTAFNTL